MAEPNPKLLSLLDKLINPIDAVNVQLEVHGMYIKMAY